MAKGKDKLIEVVQEVGPFEEKFTAIDVVFDKKTNMFYKVNVEYNSKGEAKVVGSEELGINQAIVMNKLSTFLQKKLLSITRRK